jgi:hypothetical protein
MRQTNNIPPVVLFIYNRPETTKKVFARIREAKPAQLFLIADGSKEGALEESKCAQARCIAESIDWDCQVLKLFSDKNLGCKHRISSGITWAFEHVDQAIILEDDCLPHPSFFRFCHELLEHYKNDERVMAISGNNFQFGRTRTQHSYYFSRYPHCWGWATWKRAWQHYDLDMSLWPHINNEGWLKDVLHDPAAIKYWGGKLQQTYDGKIDTWDYSWMLTCWLQSGLGILPNTNLVSNIGFAADGTHHVNNHSPFSEMLAVEMRFPLSHPPMIIRDTQADQFTQSHQFGFFARSRRKIRSTFNF